MRALVLLVALLALTPAATAATLDVDVRQDSYSESCTRASRESSYSESSDGGYYAHNRTEGESQCTTRGDDVAVDVTYGSTMIVGVSKGERTESQRGDYSDSWVDRSAPCDEAAERSKCHETETNETFESASEYSREGVFVDTAAGTMDVATSWCNSYRTRGTYQQAGWEQRPARESFSTGSSSESRDAYCENGIRQAQTGAAFGVEGCTTARGGYHGYAIWTTEEGTEYDAWDDSYSTSDCRTSAGRDVRNPLDLGLPTDGAQASAEAQRVRTCSDCGEPEETSSDSATVGWSAWTQAGGNERSETIVLP